MFTYSTLATIQVPTLPLVWYVAQDQGLLEMDRAGLHLPKQATNILSVIQPMFNVYDNRGWRVRVKAYLKANF